MLAQRAFLPGIETVWLGPRHALGAEGLARVAKLRRCGAVGSWGVGRSFNEAAREAAARSRLPYVALEDGFLRSVRPGLSGEPGSSLIADSVGVYYDATRPSRLEQLISEPTSAAPHLVTRASKVIALIRLLRVSKYNHAPDLVPASLEDRPAIVADQRRGDVSVRRSTAPDDAFAAMLRLAVAEHGRARVVVKTHPDAIVCGRASYLTTTASAEGVRLLSESVNPWAVLSRARAVYTVSSLLGFEGLMAGLPVTCFGMPFYAGWGLTRDMVACPRRQARVALEQVFAAAYFRYTRYVDRETGEPTDVETVIRQLADARDRTLAHTMRGEGRPR